MKPRSFLQIGKKNTIKRVTCVTLFVLVPTMHFIAVTMMASLQIVLVRQF
jgi:hypothetical protein